MTKMINPVQSSVENKILQKAEQIEKLFSDLAHNNPHVNSKIGLQERVNFERWDNSFSRTGVGVQ